MNAAFHTWRSRPCAGLADLPALRTLWPDCRPAAWQTDFPSPTDLAELLAAPGMAERAQVWEDAAGRVIAYALVDSYDNIRFDRLSEAADDELIAWGIADARRLAAPALDTPCRAEDATRIASLRRHGFIEQPIRTLRFARSLAEPIPEPALPAGYTIRPTAGVAEVPALVALHRAAFGTERLTVEERVIWMAAPDYEPALDLVAIAPDGSLAATCFCAIHVEENRLSGRNDGATDPLATHPTHQRRGLARALLCAGMARLRARGATRAVLGTSSENAAMQTVARSASYGIESERIWFSLPL